KTALDIPVAGGESEFTRWGFRELIARRCVDVLQPEVCGLGGISEFRKVVALATTWGIPVIPHVWGSCVAVATTVHLVASLPDQQVGGDRPGDADQDPAQPGERGEERHQGRDRVAAAEARARGSADAQRGGAGGQAGRRER